MESEIKKIDLSDLEPPVKVRSSKVSSRTLAKVGATGGVSSSGAPTVTMLLSEFEDEMNRMEAKGRKGLFEEIYRNLMPAEGTVITLYRVGGRLEIVPMGSQVLEGGHNVLFDPTESGSGMPGKVPTLKSAARLSKEQLSELMPETVEKVVDKAPTVAVGWYQDSNGNLSYFNGQAWNRDKKTPRVDIAKLEYLGE